MPKCPKCDSNNTRPVYDKDDEISHYKCNECNSTFNTLKKVRSSLMNKESLRLRPLGPNRNEVEIGDWLVLFSYQTPVCAVHQSTGEAIRTDKRWSNTTSRHVKQWLGGVDAKVVPQETLEKLINSGKLEEEKPMPVSVEKPVMGTRRVGQQESGFYGTEVETYYVASDGTVYCIESPDMAGRPEDVRQMPALPKEAMELTVGVLDPDLLDAAEQIEAGTVRVGHTAASLPDLFNSKYVKWMQQEAALLAANLGAYTSEVDAGALLDQAVQKLVATVQTAVQEEVEKVINEARENIVEAMMDDLEAKNRGIVPAAPVAGPPEIPAEFEEQPVPMAKAKKNAVTTNYEDMTADGSLYAALVAANIEVDKHESDLYFPVTEESTEILSQFTQEHLIAEKFRNQNDGSLWYDVPFAFTPYWKEKQNTMAKARRTLAQKEETEVARGMAEKGYKYIMIDTSGEIDPLYAKTPQMAAELMREDYPDKKFDVQPIDKFLGGEKTHLDAAVEEISKTDVEGKSFLHPSKKRKQRRRSDLE